MFPSVAGLVDPLAGLASKPLSVKLGDQLHAVLDAGGLQHAPALVSCDLVSPGGNPPSTAGLPPGPVLDGDAFVAAAARLPPAQLRAALENCLLECTNSRLARPEEMFSALPCSKVHTGVAGLVQLVAGGGGGVGDGPALFPPAAGLPTLGNLLRGTVLPPSATSRLISPPAVQIFTAHSQVGGDVRSAAEHFDNGSVPSMYTRGHNHVCVAARRGRRYYTLLSGVPVWQHFDVVPSAGAGGGGGQQQQDGEAGGSEHKAKGKQARQQERKQPGAAAAAAAAASGCEPPAQAGPAPPGACALRQSACSCSFPDLRTLWCVHRCDAMLGLLSDPALHVLDCDALGALLAPLGARQLAQLLLTVALLGGTLPDVVLSLQLPAAQQAALFVRRLGHVAVPVPGPAELRTFCYNAADAALSQLPQYTPADPYSAQRDSATAADPCQPPHTAPRLSVLSPAEGSVLQGVDARVAPLTPELVWHLKGMGVDALDSFPESVGAPNAAGVWPTEVRGGTSLGFEDALGLARSLGRLGGAYKPVALQLLKDLTAVLAHPHYLSASLPAVSWPSFARRLAQVWEQMATPQERWTAFVEGGMRLPAVWSEAVREVAWQVVGQLPVLWSLARHLGVAMRGTGRAAAMALLTRGVSLLPRSAGGAGGSAFTDLLLFERSMQRSYAQHAEGLATFLKQKQGQLRPAREGSLMQAAARSVAKQLLAADRPLAESHAAFQDLFLDLQEAVLAEGAALLQERAFSDVPRLGSMGLPAAAPEALLPPLLRNAGAVLKHHTVGVLNTGLSHNAEGLDRHALPPHLPPALPSSPFTWVTLDVRAMLALSSPGSAAACWAAAYLQLVPKYSPAGAVPLWTWLRQGATLALLLGGAVEAAGRRDWHAAAMLADNAGKYLASSARLVPAAAVADLAQLQAACPMLRSLAAAAAAQLRDFMVLLAPPRRAVLTHTSSLRACCLLLRAVLGLLLQALEPPLLLRTALPGGGPAGQPHQPMPDHLLAMLQQLLPHMQDMYDLQHVQAQALGAHQLVAEQAQVVAAVQHAQAAVQQAQAALAEAVGQQPAGRPLGPTPAAAAAAVVADQPLAQPLALSAAAALAADASVLVQAAQAMLDLAHGTLTAQPLLPLASSLATAGAAAAAARARQDTPLWRSAELDTQFGQYPYHHDADEDRQQARSFALNDAMVMLAQALPVALLPLLRQPPAAAAGQLASRLVDAAEERKHKYSPGVSFRVRHSASVFLTCSVLHLAGRAAGGPPRLAAMPAAWHLLSSSLLDTNVTTAGRHAGASWRPTWLGPSTLLCMLRACTLVPAGAAAGVAASTGRQQQQQQQQQRPTEDAKQGDQAAPPPAAQSGLCCLRVGDTTLDASLAKTAVQRVLTWLTTGTQEHWKGSSYALWRAPPPRIVGAAAQHAVAAAEGAHAVAGGAAAGQVVAPPPPLPPPPQQQQDQQQQEQEAVQQQQQAGAAPAAAQQGAGQQGGVQPAMEPAAAAAAMAGAAYAVERLAGLPPRQAFCGGPLLTSGVSAAFTRSWPVSAVGVLHWWLQHCDRLQPPEVRRGAAADAAEAALEPPHTLGPRYSMLDEVATRYAVLAAPRDAAVTVGREQRFVTLEGPVAVAPATATAPKLRTLCGPLLMLLCMECPLEVHRAAADALLAAAALPGGAQELVGCGPLWALQRLLLRSEGGGGVAGPPAALAAQGRRVVQAVEGALLAESADWGAVLHSQAAAAADAEMLAAERRAAAAVVRPGGAAGNPMLPQQIVPVPHWMLEQMAGNAPFDPFDPFIMPHVPPPLADEDSDFGDEEEDEGFDDEEEGFDEEDMDGEMDPWGQGDDELDADSDLEDMEGMEGVPPPWPPVF
ncbi:hypothetical protein C2E20_8752 isoform B [Micractinium conductrix]|uniref:Uncharacterized protein n=1 Tax=Micractinium conductrix TaxID=554055 RepID=A0A2P6V0H7_9CHLO|nr:hypothetical protein C2E20_8752 isoform B [Micractinium conductrix]|eukprot:PSC67596.1 hypothetical protein C2E20_8752 isoform B [Micractinium conductrix]